MLKKKCIAVMKAIAAEKHSKVPDPVDLHRFRAREAPKATQTARAVNGQLP